MRSGGNDFNYFKLTKLAKIMQFKRMFMFFFWRIGGGLDSLDFPWLRHCTHGGTNRTPRRATLLIATMRQHYTIHTST